MRYVILKNNTTNKYFIWDSVKKQQTTDVEYEIIVDIVLDKYAIVGRSYDYFSFGYNYKSYIYGLVDIEGSIILDIKYEFVYPTDSIIYCRIDGGPVNRLTYQGDYEWINKHGICYSKYPFSYIGEEKALIKVKEIIDMGYKTGSIYRSIDYNGNTLQEKEIENSQELYVLSTFFPPKYTINNDEVVYLPFLASNVDKKWSRLNDIAVQTDEKKYNRCSIRISDTITINDAKIGFAFNTFLLISKYTEHDDPINSERNIIRSNRIYYAILNDKFEVLFYDAKGFYVNTNVFWKRIIINEEYILDSAGHLLNIPKDIYFNRDSSDNNGYLMIGKDHKWGYMDESGLVVIPPIFPFDECISKDNEYFEEKWQEYKEYAADSISDAFEGDSDALWNED